ncbi:hypothetical protein SLEP1_g21304 [Rubroshorea leprosula]|uniref:Uncharacterized protein n=1 Tax=Rubroshorea leprosula TaxID=152421 RepID=A0AAV5JHI2_9ROSI|nr:hypothetical protein SLEP1_g21304 [Rubroshorea leprosula]
MEAVIGVDSNDEGRLEERFLEKSSSSLSSPKHIANPVVYKLVRVEGDGTFVPATDDELMEVEGLLENEKQEIPIVSDTGQSLGGMPIEMSSSSLSQFESSEGLPQYKKMGAGTVKLNSRLEYIEEMLQKVKQEERLHLACRSPNHSSANVNVDSQSSEQHNKLPGFDEKLQSQIPLQDTTDASVAQSLSDHHLTRSGSIGECSKPSEGLKDGGSSISVGFTCSTPDFSKLKGEVCLDNLSIRELHEIFKATFGRETTVKDKQWLKRRITMGLTNSCDVSTPTFRIKDNKLLKNANEGSFDNVNDASTMDPVFGMESCKDSPDSHSSGREVHQISLGQGLVNSGMEDSYGGEDLPIEQRAGRRVRKPTRRFIDDSPIVDGSEREVQQISLGQGLINSGMEDNYGSEDLTIEQRVGKRVRKPTRRYIEELSEAESKEYNGKLIASGKNSGIGPLTSKSFARPARNIDSEQRTIITRIDSLGGFGVQVPCVYRVRRSRPRKNVMDLMKFHPSDMGMTATLLSQGQEVHSLQMDNTNGDKVLEVSSAPEQLSQQLVAEPYKERQCSSLDVIDRGQNMEQKNADSFEYPSDDNVARLPTSKVRIRRKHHRAWTLHEVMKLVDGVSKYGAGRWSEIRRLAFASYSYRTSVDLKDKWRNLLKASFSQTPDKGVNSRKHPSMPIPPTILLRVRELAEMQAQVQPNLSTSKLVTSGRSVLETKSGYL